MNSKSSQEFQEIAHCGGRITISTETDERGHRLVAFGFRHSSPTAAALFAISADEIGNPLGMIELGGLVSRGSDDPPAMQGYTVFIASDSEGMFGHQCPRCNGYWRSRGAPSKWRMTCPYCGLRAETHNFLTMAQHKYVQHCCQRFEEIIHSDFVGESVINMDNVADAVASDKKPDFYYAEQRQQNNYCCVSCGGNNDILGRYGYCSICGTHNGLQELQSEILAAKKRIEDASYEGALSDMVSAFDSFARQLAKQMAARIPMRTKRRNSLERALFHNIKPRADELANWFDIELFKDIDSSDTEFIVRMFLRRHVYEHNGGEVDERYIKESGDTSVQLKQRIRETSESATRMAQLIEKIGRNFKVGFDEIFPPVSRPIQYEESRKQMMKRS